MQYPSSLQFPIVILFIQLYHLILLCMKYQLNAEFPNNVFKQNISGNREHLKSIQVYLDGVTVHKFVLFSG